MSAHEYWSHLVIDTRKPITSQTGVNRAAKARIALSTAQAILRKSGDHATAEDIHPALMQLTHQIALYYRKQRLETTR